MRLLAAASCANCGPQIVALESPQARTQPVDESAPIAPRPPRQESVDYAERARALALALRAHAQSFSGYVVTSVAVYNVDRDTVELYCLDASLAMQPGWEARIHVAVLTQCSPLVDPPNEFYQCLAVSAHSDAVTFILERVRGAYVLVGVFDGDLGKLSSSDKQMRYERLRMTSATQQCIL